MDLQPNVSIRSIHAENKTEEKDRATSNDELQALSKSVYAVNELGKLKNLSSDQAPED